VTPVLALADVTFRRDGKQIIDGISLTVQRGEHWALLGPNGAGKSTLLGFCAAVTFPTTGTVHVLGEQMGRVDLAQIRRSIGHVNPRPPAAVFAVRARGRADRNHRDYRHTDALDPDARTARPHRRDDRRGWLVAQGRRRMADAVAGRAWPTTTTHALLIAEGRTVAMGSARSTVTTDNVSAAFAHPVVVGYDEGRWTARAKATRIIDV
jgi:iron complex transport system ATP-binding protein